MIASFSWRHEEHLFAMLEYAFAVRKTSHVRAGVAVFSFFFFHFPYLTSNGSTVIRKNTFACLFSINNTISLSRHEQVCLSGLRFQRYFSHHRAKK